MSVIGIVTNSGLTKSIEAANHEGWHIFPTEFRVADTAGVFSANRDFSSLEPTWYTAPISGKIDMSPNTIQCNCTIPPGQSLGIEEIQEIYLNAKDIYDNEFLLFLGQPENTIFYDPSGAVSLRLQITIANIDITALYEFNYTQANEISDHTVAPNAHISMLEDRMSEHNANSDANDVAFLVHDTNSDAHSEAFSDHNVDPNAHEGLLKNLAYRDVTISHGMVHSAAMGDKIHCLTSYGECTIYISEGTGEIKVIDEDASCADNNIFIKRNGVTIYNKPEDLIMDENGATIMLNGSEANYTFEYPLTVLPSEAIIP